MKSVFAVQGRGLARLSALLGGLRRSVAGACGAAVFALMWCAHAQAAVLTPPAAECSALQAKYRLFSILSGWVGGSSTGASPAKRILDAR
jgi:hypothetical protein